MSNVRPDLRFFSPNSMKKYFKLSRWKNSAKFRANVLRTRFMRWMLLKYPTLCLNQGIAQKVYTQPHEVGGLLLDSVILESECISPSIYKLAHSYTFSQIYGPVYFSKFSKAEIIANSDLVKTCGGIYWYKGRHPAFPHMVPLDSNLIAHDGANSVIVKSDSKIEVYHKAVFSLLGVASGHWAHFLAQYFPKLRFIPQALKLAPNLVVVASSRLDEQARFLLSDALSEFGLDNKVNFIDDLTLVKCDELFYADHQSWIMDHGVSVSPLSVVIPKGVVDFLKNRFATVDFDRNYLIIKKIYLRRGGARSTSNIEEIDNIMLRHGFTVLDPSTLTLQQKKSVFSQARFIVGQYGSGFTNILMCSPGCKVVAFSNTSRINDNYIAALRSICNVEFTLLIGVDHSPGDPHSSCSISAVELEALLTEIETEY